MKHTIIKLQTVSHLPLTKYLMLCDARQPMHNYKILYAWNLFAAQYHMLFRLSVHSRYVMLVVNIPGLALCKIKNHVVRVSFFLV